MHEARDVLYIALQTFLSIPPNSTPHNRLRNIAFNLSQTPAFLLGLPDPSPAAELESLLEVTPEPLKDSLPFRNGCLFFS